MAATFVSSDTMQNATGAGPFTFNLTAGTGSNLLLCAAIIFDNTAGLTVTSVKWNTVAMTAAGAPCFNSAVNTYAVWYYLAAPATGLHALDIVMSGAVGDLYANITTAAGANQANPIRKYVTPPNNPTTDGAGGCTIAIPSSTSDLTLACWNSGSGHVVTTDNQTLDSTNTLGGFSAGNDHGTTASSQNLHVPNNTVASDNFAIVGLSINGDLGPLITVQPTDQRVLQGSTATFTITAVGVGTLHYQWKLNGSNVGTDSSSYTTAASTMADNLSIVTCVVTDDISNTTSTGAYWLVVPAAPIWLYKA